MKKTMTLLTLLWITAAASAQRPCSAPEYRQFDFWIGEWEAYNLKGQKAGDSKISLLLDSCVIQEEWTSTNITKGLRFAGKSYNSYNAAAKKWQQYWVDNTGTTVSYFNGHYEANKMIVETAEIKQADGTNKIQRMTFFNLGPDKVRQFGESSVDGGKSWKADFDLEYRRKKAG